MIYAFLGALELQAIELRHADVGKYIFKKNILARVMRVTHSFIRKAIFQSKHVTNTSLIPF